MEETLSVELPAETWKLIFFLVKRGVLKEMENEHIHAPGCGCINGFASAMLELSKRLPEAVTEPRREIQTRPQTSPTTE